MTTVRHISNRKLTSNKWQYSAQQIANAVTVHGAKPKREMFESFERTWQKRIASARTKILLGLSVWKNPWTHGGIVPGKGTQHQSQAHLSHSFPTNEFAFLLFLYGFTATTSHYYWHFGDEWNSFGIVVVPFVKYWQADAMWNRWCALK